MEDFILKVTYPGPANADLDKKIISSIEQLGFKWYAQGTDSEPLQRDISFKKKLIF
jgi:hypothetical protein